MVDTVVLLAFDVKQIRNQYTTVKFSTAGSVGKCLLPTPQLVMQSTERQSHTPIECAASHMGTRINCGNDWKVTAVAPYCHTHNFQRAHVERCGIRNGFDVMVLAELF